MSSAANALWLAVHFPRLGFEVHGLTANDDADNRPAVLIDENRVAQADALAQRAGIHTGATLATAHSIAPELRHFPRDPEAEGKRLEWLALVGYRYSSRVSLAPPAQVLVEAHGSLRLFGGLAALTGALAARYRLLGHETRIATAATPLAAQALAHWPESAAWQDAPCPIAASQALRDVPVACADLEERQVERLANMGVTRLGQLLDLPPRELGQRFPPALLDYLHRLTGRKADPRPPIAPPERFRFHVHLLEGVQEKDALLPPMRSVVERLTRRLAARNLGARLLAWTFKPLSGQAVDVHVRLAEASADPAALLRLSRLRLERIDLPSEVMSVSLRTDLVTPLLPAGADFLDANGSGAPSNAIKRAELVDLLAARLGDEAVRALAAVDDHRPEAAWAATPVAASTRAATPSTAKPGTRPLWLLDPPQPVSARGFTIESGPERIETGWWDAAQTRDYFIATAPSGSRCWLYRDRHNRWFLHGYFS